MKLSKEDLKQKIDTYEIADEIKISLLEDIEDSFETGDSSELEEIKAKYEELKIKYKERFLNGDSETKEETEEEVPEEVKEEEEIDVEEI